MKLNQFILSVILSATAFSAWADDSYQHIRNATAKVEYAGQTFLIDPFFAPKHSIFGNVLSNNIRSILRTNEKLLT